MILYVYNFSVYVVLCVIYSIGQNSQLSAGYCHVGWLVGGKSCLSRVSQCVCPRMRGAQAGPRAGPRAYTPTSK